MLPIELHEKLLAEQVKQEKERQAAIAIVQAASTSSNPIPAGKSLWMTMIPCIIAHPGVVADHEVTSAFKEICDSIDTAEIASSHLLEGASIVPLLPEINRENRQLTFVMNVTVDLGAHLSDVELAKINPARLATEIIKSLAACNTHGVTAQVLLPTLSPTQPNAVDPFEQ